MRFDATVAELMDMLSDADRTIIDLRSKVSAAPDMDEEIRRDVRYWLGEACDHLSQVHDLLLDDLLLGDQ